MDTLNTPQIASDGAQTDETTVEAWDTFVERQLAATSAGDVPPALSIAANGLVQLAIGAPGVPPICDYGTPADYHAGLAAIELCRAALDEIAIAYAENMARTVVYHRAALADIEAAGLLEVE